MGGCVRDALLGLEPDDWDITTSAEPEEVKALFHRTIDTGIKHGTVTVRMDGKSFEVTTYRIDGKYEDGRHPEEVTFTKSLEEDLKRRDFTINAMAYNDSTGIVDLFGGQDDLCEKMIRCVGDPLERFSEDALRMMRAVRFAAKLDFSIEEETKKAISELKDNLSKVSAERIQVELTKLITSDHPEQLRTLYETGLTSVFFPEWDVAMECEQNTKHHCYTVGEHSIVVMQHVRAFQLEQIIKVQIHVSHAASDAPRIQNRTLVMISNKCTNIFYRIVVILQTAETIVEQSLTGLPESRCHRLLQMPPEMRLIPWLRTTCIASTASR